MKSFYPSVLALVIVLLVACDYNAKNFPDYDKNRPEDIKTLEYTMTPDDYKSVASNKVNQQIAKQAEEEAQLKAVDTQKAFNVSATAQKYLPAWLAATYPTADEKSAIRITHSMIENLPEYVLQIAGCEITTLAKNDYPTDTNFFTPSMTADTHLPAILQTKIAETDDNTIVFVNYNEADHEKNVQGASPILKAALYQYKSSAWSKYTDNNAMVLQKSDFESMGLGYDNFSGTQNVSYIPVFLKNKYPYAAADKKFTIVYKYYASGKTTTMADEYVYDGESWKINSGRVEKTDQFVFTNAKWMYNPSVTIDLSPIRNEPTIKAYYQACVDWVWENIDVPAGCTAKGQGYVSSYGNNDYYSGASAYYNNFDWRPSAAKAQKPDVYGELSDSDIRALLQQHLIEVLPHMLSAKHPEAAPVDGIEVIYTINMPIFEGTNITKNNFTIKYMVVGKAQFKYVEDSFKSIE